MSSLRIFVDIFICVCYALVSKAVEAILQQLAEHLAVRYLRVQAHIHLEGRDWCVVEILIFIKTELVVFVEHEVAKELFQVAVNKATVPVVHDTASIVHLADNVANRLPWDLLAL